MFINEFAAAGQLDYLFYGGKGKGFSKGKRSSGFGTGRKKNPIGPDGSVMKCHKCGSEEHLQRDCTSQQMATWQPQPPAASPSGFYIGYTGSQGADEQGPLSGIEQEAGGSAHGAASVLMIRAVDDGQGVQKSQWQEPASSSGLRQPPMWSGQPAASAPVDATGYPTPGSSVYMMPAPMPPSLPQFVTDDGFGYLHHGYNSAVPLDQMPEPLFGGATGGLAPSRLDKDQGTAIESLHALENMLQQTREDPFSQSAATVDYRSPTTSDPINKNFISDFGMIQEALETQRLEGKAQHSNKGKGKGKNSSRYAMPRMPGGLRQLAQTQEERRLSRSGPSTSSAPPDPDALEDGSVCPICLNDYEANVVVVRLSCRHLLHSGGAIPTLLQQRQGWHILLVLVVGSLPPLWLASGMFQESCSRI